MKEKIPLTSIEVRPEIKKYSPARPLKKVFLLNFCIPFGLYSCYWFYCNWDDFRGRAWPEKSNARLKLLGLFIPILGFFLIYRQFKTIQDYTSKITDVPRISPFLLASVFYLSIFFDVLSYQVPESVEPLLSLGIFVIFGLVMTSFQRILNRFWEQELPETPISTYYSTWEKVFLTLGGFYWAFTGISLLLHALNGGK